MKLSERYPHLTDLIETYLHQDYDLYADTIEGVIDYYLGVASRKDKQGLLDNIKQFANAHAGQLDRAFIEAYPFDFNPEAYGITAGAFLKQLEEKTVAALQS